MARLFKTLALLMLCTASAAHASCRQALALGLDVSGSVDAQEYRLQLDGLASALMRPDVGDAFLAFPDAPVRLHVFEWAGQFSQITLIPWTDIRSTTDLRTVATTLRSKTRSATDPSTAIGQAMLHGARALSQQPDCWRHTLDLSGDGKSNTGPRPRDVTGSPALNSITINGLVIGSGDQANGDQSQAEIGELWAYCKNEVMRGPGAFIETALGFEDFENAMARKLLKELQSLAVSDATPAALQLFTNR